MTGRKTIPLLVTIALLHTVSTYAGWIALDSDQAIGEPNPVPDAFGTGIVELNEDETALTYSVTVTGLSGDITAAHFHGLAPPGEAAGVVHGISFDGNHAEGVWDSSGDQPLTPELVDALKAGLIYLNVHTAQNPPGEIRGQVHMGESFNATLDQDQAVPAPSDVPGAAGTGFAVLTADGIIFQLTVTGLSGAVNAAHFHGPADPGVGAGVARDVPVNGFHGADVWRADDGQPLTADLIQALMDGRLYFNVHTALNGPGEIRGQLLKVESASNAENWTAYE